MRYAVLSVLAFFLLMPHAASAEGLPQTYKGYDCTKDCSGHKAGYAWAQKKGITDIHDCRGKSRSFVEGCRSWVLEQNDDDADPDRGDDQESISDPE